MLAELGRVELVVWPVLAAVLGEAVGAMTVAELRPAGFQGTFAT